MIKNDRLNQIQKIKNEMKQKMVMPSTSGLQGASMIVKVVLDTRPLNRGVAEIKRGFSDIKSDGEG